jgi:DNA-binding NtrC family response regulator
MLEPTSPVAHPLAVLVVEDNLDAQFLCCEMLKAYGFHADGVGHAEGALSLLAGGSYQVLFSDIGLPGMSGVDLARLALQRQPALRVVFASGYGDSLLRHVDFPHQSLQKPFDIERLRVLLEAVDAERKSL